MNRQTARVSAVIHANVDIACEPARVWADMVEAFVEGRSLSEQGCRIEPLHDDPTALYGGYRVVISTASGEIVDERIVRVTERDDGAMRLSLCVQTLVPEETGMLVNASCQASPISGGTHYEAHSHANFDVPDCGAPSVAEAVAVFRKQAGDYLVMRQAAMKVRLETRTVKP